MADWAEPRPPGELLRCLPDRPGRFILESQGGPADIARWSFLGHQPFRRLEYRRGRLRLTAGAAVREWAGDPFSALQEQLDEFALPPIPGLPPFIGGAVGYLGYDLGRILERLPDVARDDLQLPELRLDFYDHLAVYDHADQRVCVLALNVPTRSGAVQDARDLAALLQAPSRASTPVPLPASVPIQSNFTRAAYCDAVGRALDYIGQGQIYQVNLSQRFSAPARRSAEELYDWLRLHNPAPFAALLNYEDLAVVSASPERFLQIDLSRQTVETRPIKGTRPRGATPADDARLRSELLASSKDEAELVMIVDLERNDLGRVCEYGSVQVLDLRRLEAYPSVWHSVATVAGRLRPGLTTADALRATFPGGSITGAPKIRAMSIIEELEGLRRGVYCGAIGWFGFDGRSDLNIAIRTMTLKDGQAYFNAGGGIVADSEPLQEYEETLHKARALARALGADLSRLEPGAF